MQTTEQATKHPFHETIVEVIGRASSRDLECLGALIKATNVPKGHDEIIAAWEKRRQELGWMPRQDLGVPADLLKQKQAGTISPYTV
ncbi:MAG: hypothetical protein G01um101429_276 [Parcubacteria group bacterium Gr01-1014_29]|nr:MAG: hypothetical protein G01um101429_276 [Parcubacteria group bacterium Gr01-1014_29]